MVASSFSEAPSSKRTFASSMSRISFSIVVVSCSSDERLRLTACAFFGSSQNPGASVCPSRRWMSAFSLGRSKMPP